MALSLLYKHLSFIWKKNANVCNFSLNTRHSPYPNPALPTHQSI